MGSPGGRSGYHAEQLGHLLPTMQNLRRSHPGAALVSMSLEHVARVTSASAVEERPWTGSAQ